MRHLIIQFVLVTLASALATVLAPGQFQVHDTFNGDSAGDYFGTSVARVGDVDGDGLDDLVVGAPFDTFAGPISGSAYLISGGTGAILDAVHGASGDFLGLHVAGAGDVDGDGTPDFIVGSEAALSNAGRFWVYSGDGSGLIHSVLGPAGTISAFGSAIDGIGDLDGDGHDEFLVGASGANSNGTAAGSAFVYDGTTGLVIKTFHGAASFDRFGFSVAGLGDVNGDGVPDFAIGATGSDAGYLDAGSVFVHSGADWSLIRVHHGRSTGDRFGYSVASAGDVDRDGRADLVVGAEDDDYNGAHAGSVTVLSGSDGSEILYLAGSASNDHFGGSVAGGQDIDGDGFDDLLVGARGSDVNGAESGSVYLYSGLGGSLIAAIAGDAASDQLGYDVALLRDVNGDGFADPCGAAPLASVASAQDGMVRVWRAPTQPVLSYDTLIGLGHRLDLRWLPDGGSLSSMTGTLSCAAATPGGLGLYGVSFAATDLLYFGYLPVLIADDPANLIETGNFGFDYAGQIVIPGVSRQYPWIAGWNVHLQFYETGPIISSSNGIRLLMEP